LLATFSAAQGSRGPGAAKHADAVEVTLGRAAAPLYGPWKFTVGDSPIDPKTGQPTWAEPGFDDSQWETVDLTPKEGALDPIGGISGYVPGWTERGHTGHSGYAWYRIRVRCQGEGSSPLALAGPADVDDAYQAFANGTLLGSFGKFSGKQPTIYVSQPVQFRVPGSCRQQGGEQVLAFRFWMDPGTLLQEPGAGGMHSAPLLGEADVIALHFQSQWLELIRADLTYPLEGAAFALLAMVAFSLILFDRSDQVYLWIGLLFLATAGLNGWSAVSSWTQWIPARLTLAGDGAGLAIAYSLWVLVWWVWFGRQGLRWLPGALAGLAVLYVASRVLGQEIFPGWISHPAALRLYALNQGLRFVLFGLLAWIAIRGIRHRGLEGWLVLPVVLLRCVSTFGVDLIRLHLFHNWIVFGVVFTPVDVANLLVAAVIALLLLRRLLHSVKRQRLMALDVKQAQEVQQVILPKARMVLPGLAGLAGLTIESEYRPAREVGGDFFQIIPHTTDGSVLIVAGDVTGKGMQAGMLVALLVGAIRTAAETSDEPADVLGVLNRRLMGRGDAQATCLALRIDADGGATLANAGHVAPYLNGEELAMEGALPLGVFEGAEASVMRFALKEGDRLVLMSDGVAEATNEKKELFGFARVLELIRSQPTAAGIANAAQAFGQEDDISVIAVTRGLVAAGAFSR
jgi:hypothetical protein